MTAEPVWARQGEAAGQLSFSEGPARSDLRPGLAINSASFGLLIFLATEAMFFAGLISAFLILRAGHVTWPPLDQPRLPVAATGINTLFLILSAYTMQRALQSIRAGKPKALTSWLLATGVLGVIFLSVQGFEWLRLVQFGLTFNSSIYGGTFYALIGCHGVHVLVAVIVLFVVVGRAINKRYSVQNHTAIELCRMYWLFVAGVWPVLYLLVYLS